MRRHVVGVPVAALVAVAMVVGTWASPVSAGGGSLLEPDREWYRAGDVVHLAGDVRKLDRDWHGPYTVTLHSLATPDEVGPGIPVGRLVVTRLDDETVRAEVTFVLPKLEDGTWLVSYCSPGCSHSLGDLRSGGLHVGPPPAPLPPPTTAVPIPTTVAAITTVPRAAEPSPSEPGSGSEPGPASPSASSELQPLAADAAAPADDALVVPTTGSPPDRSLVWWFLGAGVLAAAAAVVSRLRASGPRRVVTSGATGPNSSTEPSSSTESEPDDDFLGVTLRPLARDDEPVEVVR